MNARHAPASPAELERTIEAIAGILLALLQRKVMVPRQTACARCHGILRHIFHGIALHLLRCSQLKQSSNRIQPTTRLGDLGHMQTKIAANQHHFSTRDDAIAHN